MQNHNCKECHAKSAAAKHLNDAEFEILESNSAKVSFKKGEVIFKQDALSLNVAYLHCGIVKLHMRGPTGEKILRIVKAPTYLGIPTTFGDKINQFSATALIDTSVCFIDSNLFRNFIFTNGKFAYEIIVELCKNELFDYKRYTSQSQKQVTGFVAETILCFADKIYMSDQFELPVSRSEFGDLIGTSRESISRVLADLNNEKIIALNTKEISILDKERLNQISERG
jgi:CRP/FNR family transcriptional regulator